MATRLIAFSLSRSVSLPRAKSLGTVKEGEPYSCTGLYTRLPSQDQSAAEGQAAAIIFGRKDWLRPNTHPRLAAGACHNAARATSAIIASIEPTCTEKNAKRIAAQAFVGGAMM